MFKGLTKAHWFTSKTGHPAYQMNKNNILAKGGILNCYDKKPEAIQPPPKFTPKTITRKSNALR